VNSRLLAHIRGNSIAYLALFVALSGTAIAADVLPRNSVGTKQLKKGAVTAKKVKKNSLTGKQIRESTLGRVPSASRALRADDATKLAGRLPGSFLGATAKAADAERWDGADSAVLGTAETYAGSNFEPRDSAGGTAKTYVSTGAIHCAGANSDFHARIQLPQGARIAGLDYAFVDNNAGSSSLELMVFDSLRINSALSDGIVTASSTGQTGAAQLSSASPADPHTVDNDRWSYQLVWTPGTCANTSQLIGARVRYSIPRG
jgi:hypothetical protein